MGLLTITNLIEALTLNNSGSFSTLKDCVVVSGDGDSIVPERYDNGCVHFVVAINDQKYKLYIWLNSSSRECFCRGELARALPLLGLNYFVEYRYLISELLVFDTMSQSHTCDIALEYIADSVSLSDFIIKNKSDKQALLWVRDQLQVVSQDLSIAPIAHSDVSLKNIVVSSDMKLKLVSYSKAVLKGDDAFDRKKAKDKSSFDQIISYIDTTIETSSDVSTTYNTGIYETVSSYVENVAVVSSHGRYGLINRDGKLIVPLQYDGIDEMREGFAIVELAGYKGVVDKYGALILDAEYDDIMMPDVNGLFVVSQEGRWGLKNCQGKDIICCSYDQIGDFYDTFAPARLGDKWGIIDNCGRQVVPFKYDSICKRRLDDECFVLRTGCHYIEYKL